MLRLDLLHPLIGGNKWYKLRLNLQAAKDQGYTKVLSFGGAYSNHLHALSAAGKLMGLDTIGVVRGESAQPLNATLTFARQQGMALHHVTRTDYRDKNSPVFIARLHEQFGDFYLIPEGGANVAGTQGCAEIARLLHWSASSTERIVALACGTGTTLAGLLLGRTEDYRVLGMAVLKGDFLEHDVREMLQQCGSEDPGNWQISLEWHCGGYARVTPELLEFIHGFYQRTGIPLEPVYTGKLMMGLYHLLARGEFAPGSELIAVHTGGLQAFLENIPTWRDQ
ncbi:MAG: pyridoxal-phosphate dependent enzyme [Pseudomonadota bacterium]